MKIQRRFVEDIMMAASGKELLPLIQEAIRLEHATIPAYLCAYFTLKPGTNLDIARILRSVVIDEMLHMTLAANLMNALGGAPVINQPGFVPSYPSDLPMGIGDNLKVHLRKCSIDQLKNVFMEIEKPEDPIIIRTPLPQFETIGAFYRHLSEKIGELGPSIFVGDDSKQVVANRWFTEADEMFAITDVKSAQRAIEVIVDQGEGTSVTPFDEDGAPSHYYRFEQIVKGQRLIPAPGQTPPFAYGGDLVIFDPNSVVDMDGDPSLSRYAPTSMSLKTATMFSTAYTSLLNALHETYNGKPEGLDRAIGIMYELRLLAQKVLSTPAKFATGATAAGTMTGLCFEYTKES